MVTNTEREQLYAEAMRELEGVLDPGAVWKHGVLVTARREIERLRAEVEEWKAIAFLNAGSVQSQQRGHL